MNVRDSDFDRLLADWLEDDQFVAPTAPVDAAVDFARTHPRHRDWFAFFRREAMTTHRTTGPAVVIIFAIVAVLVLAVGGVVLIGSPASRTAAPSPSAPASSDAKDLEALLPNTIGGIKLFKISMTGSDWVDRETRGDGDAAYVGWANSVGKSLDDVSFASATLRTDKGLLFVDAFRVKGVDHITLISTLQTAMRSRSTWGPWITVTLGGKTVQAPTGTGVRYLYGTADMIFIVQSEDREGLAAEMFAALP